MLKTLLFSTALLFSVSASAAIDALNFSSPQQEDDYHALTQELRCPQSFARWESKSDSGKRQQCVNRRTTKPFEYVIKQGE